MSESQLDEIEASNELLDWKDNEDTWRQGSGGPDANLEHAETSDTTYRYIPMSVLKKDFPKPRIQRLLDVLFLGSEEVAPDAETILKKYLRPFLIIVLIAHGRQISRFVEHDNLKDDRLPFLALPDGLQESSTWFPSFCENQWHFYPVQFTYNMDRNLSSRHVLPLRYGRKLGGRGSAITYKIRIDAEYNGLQTSTPGELNTLERNRDTFVIKSYQTNEAQECYETVCDGFRKLRHDSKPPANIIAFYGNFMLGTSRNILLEYADRGTLQDYIMNVQPPEQQEQIREFWHNVLALFDGLAMIHGKEEKPWGKHNFMIGWHRDLSPSKILVQSGKSGRPHDCRFNIAGLEHSHFQKSVGVRDATSKDSQGTFAYGAPESFNPDLLRWDSVVDQKVDVWSIGCILSVLAVWVTLGPNTVAQYHQARAAEFRKTTGKEGQCFHDEIDILNAVRAIHQEVKDGRRMIDEWTVQVINSIEEEMMLVNPKSRKTANHLYHRFKHFIDDPLVADISSVLSEPVPERGEYKTLPLAEALNIRRQDRRSLVSRIAESLNLRRQDRRSLVSRFAETFAHTQLTDSLKGRDHVFVVDTSPFMYRYQPLMEQWLEVIGDMVQDADPDGMDVYFTDSSKRSQVKSWKKLVSGLHRQSFSTSRPGNPHRFEVPHLIERILEDYRNQFTDTHYIKNFFGVAGVPQKGPRKMAMYVLTSGDWSGRNDLESQIRALVESLRKNGMQNKQVAIQFLRFGDLPRGKENLDKLERGLDLELDIIDTEPAEGGDVYKVLLGAMIEVFDMSSDLIDTGLAKASDPSKAIPGPIDETFTSDHALASPSSQPVEDELESILSSCGPDEVSDVVCVVFLLTVTQRPVSPNFLQAAMRYRDGPPPNVAYIVALLRPVISLESGMCYIKHPALREWSAHNRSLGGSFGAGPYNAIAAHELLARMTLTRVWEQGRSITNASDPFGSEEVEAYCARYWMEHFRQANNLLHAHYLSLAYEAFVEVKGPIRWIYTYEVSTVREIPYHRTLEPLFGGCYFGLRAVVDRALQKGMDMEAKDQYWKSPLHWASELAHIEIVDALLSNGASADTQDCAGWTALHFAAQNGHSAVIDLFIRNTDVRINIKAFDGKTPLQLAIESNHLKVVSQLIKAGAAPSLETYGGSTSYLQVASQYGDPQMCQLLLSSIAVSGDLLQSFIDQNLHAMLALLIGARAEVIKASYPWIVELQEDKLSVEEIADLLLKSENLHWIEADQSSIVPSLEGGLPESVAHNDKCIHTLDLDEISRETSTNHKLKADVTSEAETSDTSPSTSSSGSITSLSDGLLDPLEYFGRLERREQTTLKLCGIGGVFSPDVPGLNPGFALLKGKEACLHYGDSGKAPTRHPRRWDQDTARKIARAFENLLRAIYCLHNDSGCCDCFTILISTSARAGVVSMRRIKFASLLDIFHKLDVFQPSSLASSCIYLLQELGLGTPFRKSIQDDSRATTNAHRCLHIAAELAQICSVGLVTYTRGHSRDFQSDHLSRPIDVFRLLGTDPEGPSVSAQRVRLACLDNMLKRKVWVFCLETELARNADQRFCVSTSIQDLIDTWGGNAMVDAKVGHVFVEIGGGSVYATDSNAGTNVLAAQDEVLCHWSSHIHPGSAMKGSMTAKDKLLIGVTCINESCHLDNEACQNAIPPGALHVMGTRSPSWKTSSRAFNLAFSAKGIVSGGGALTQVKDNGKFQKPRMMEKCKNPNILNKPWGLELSLCTGIARRVLLREFFYGEVLEYLAIELAGEWREIEEVAGKIATVSDLEFSAIIKELTKDQGKVMKKVTESLLLAMETTEVGDDGHTLTLWWPERHEATPRGIKFHKDQYSGATPWITMIKESETCAVFGLATSRCLEHHDVKTCRNTVAPAVCSHLENIMLNTYLVSVATTMMSLPLSYIQGQRLQLYKRDDTILEVTRAAVPLQNVVRVKFIPGQWPMILLRRRTKKWQEVLERQARCDQSQEVLVL